MTRKNTHKEKHANSTITRREEIIQVAAKIFAVKGYHSTTLDEIASELLMICRLLCVAVSIDRDPLPAAAAAVSWPA